MLVRVVLHRACACGVRVAGWANGCGGGLLRAVVVEAC